MRKILGALLFFFGTAVPAIAQTYSEILDGDAQVERSGAIFRVGRGARIFEGDRLAISRRVQILLPYGAAVITKREGSMRFSLLRREGCGIRVHMVYRGGIGAKARPKTCRDSAIVFENYGSGAYFSPWANRQARLIPNTLIAEASPVSVGSEFALADRGDSALLAVADGAVEAQNQNVAINVLNGQGNITEKGKPPGPAIALDTALTLKLNPSVTPFGYRLNAGLNPLNSLFYHGTEILPLREIEWPVLGNSLDLEVRGVDGRSRFHSFPLPRRR